MLMLSFEVFFCIFHGAVCFIHPIIVNLIILIMLGRTVCEGPYYTLTHITLLSSYI